MKEHLHSFTHRGERYVILPETMQALRGDLPEAPHDRVTPILEPRDVPVAAMVLLLTQSCNLRCTYCYGDSGRFGGGGKMKLQTALKAVDWLVMQSGRNKTLRIAFMGGEPILNFEVLRDTVLYAKDRCRAAGKRVEFGTTSNGTLFTKEIIRFCKEHRVSVQISVDGPKALHDANRPFANGTGSFDAVAEGARLVLEQIPEASGHAVVTLGTDPRAVRQTFEDLGFGDYSMLPATGTLFGNLQTSVGSVVSETPYASMMEEDAEAWLQAVRACDRARLAHLQRTTAYQVPLRALLHDVKSFYPCGAGLGLVGVSITGGVYLCHRFVGQEEYRLGDIDTPDLDRTRWRDSPLQASPDCTACFAKYYCAGGCKHDNAAANGDAFTPAAETCALRRRQLELAAYVVANLDAEDRAFLTEERIILPKSCPLDF